MRQPLLARSVRCAVIAVSLGSAPGRVAGAQWPTGVTIDQTPHNLTRPASNPDPEMAGRIRNYGEVCVYCHTPHSGAAWLAGPRSPLFNRPRPNAGYRMPDHSPRQMLQDPSPSERSRLCLSCHDGTVGLDRAINRPNHYQGPGPANHTIDECEGCHSGGNPAAGIDWEGVWLRPDMRKQHPFSVLYDPSRRPGKFRPAAGNDIGGLPLFGGKVECATCHEPHSQQYRYFLRRSNAGNSLCLVCHTSQPPDPVHER